MNASSGDSLTYQSAGVDIDAGNDFVEAIKPLARSTNRTGNTGGLGGFGGLFDLKATGYKDPVLVAATDGVGTKLKLAIDQNKFNTIGIDLVAMCVNDLVVQGAEPLFFLDYYATSKLKVEEGRDIVAGIAEGCRQAGASLLGGETAEMPGLYQKGDFDLAGFSVGAVERDRILDGSKVEPGNIILGLASNGIHSNGFSLVRKILERTGGTSDHDFLTPTRIYVKSCLAALKSGGVHALAHITGGGLPENLPRVLPKTEGGQLGANIDCNSWKPAPVFKFLADGGNVETQEMLRVFNCGIGMAVIVDPSKKAEISQILQDFGETVFEIGEVTNSGDVAFSNTDALFD